MMVAEQSACLFCPPCVKWDFCYEFHNSQSLFKHVTLIMPNIKWFNWWCKTIKKAIVQRLNQNFLIANRVRVNSIISTPTPTPEVSTPTPTPANLQNINSNSNSNSGGFNSNSNSGKSPEYQLQLQLQLRRFQLQLQFQLRRFQLQFQLQLRSFKSNPNSISNPINLVQLNYHYQITMWNIVWIKWRYAVDICHVVPNLDQTGQHWHSRW